jgi:hypothetical protein
LDNQSSRPSQAMALRAIAIRGSERGTDGVNDWTTLYICVYHVEYIYIYIYIYRDRSTGGGVARRTHQL